ncbi:MAG: alpha/beta hydrolase [Gammaproteobacteria bacterium]|nr:alpha/beta hydrolase [Gammaproteobacteria bacterium]
MKRTLSIIVVILSFVLLFKGCQSTGGTKESQATSVVTIDKRIESVNSFTILLDDAIREIRSSDNYDNFILFIHGRGKHPEKAFKESLISDLESDYSSKVIMYHWPSWEGFLAFPEGSARTSAKDFVSVLRELREYKRNNSQLIEGINFTLLAHSMGSIVLEQSILEMEHNAFGDIFDTVVVSSSASAGKGHSNWVSKIDLSDHIYITVNTDDSMLGRAGIKTNARRLGKGLQNRAGVDFELASNAKYIDLTESTLRHRYYIHKELTDRPVAKAFFDRVLNGLPAILDQGHGVGEVKRERIYILRRSK